MKTEEKKLQAESFDRASGNASAAFDATIVLVIGLAVFHFENFNRAGGDAGSAAGAFVLVDLDRHDPQTPYSCVPLLRSRGFYTIGPGKSKTSFLRP